MSAEIVPAAEWTREEAEEFLIVWAQFFHARDAFVVKAVRAGVAKHRVHVLTGIARTTIDRIVQA